MKILFIVPYPPNLIRVRPYNIIRTLSERGHQVTVCTLYTSRQEHQDACSLQQICQTVHLKQLPKWRSLLNSLSAVPSQVPLQAKYSWEPGFAQEIEHLCYSSDGKSQFDVIHVEHLRGSKYGTYIKKAISQRPNPIPIVWDSVDCISLLFRLAASQSQGFQRWITKFELPRTVKYERQMLAEFAHICVTSKIDQAAFIDLAKPGKPASEIHVVPNGVDLNYFTVGKQSSRLQDTLVVSGKMSYHANISMVLYLVHEIMPFIWSQCPQAKLQIVGKDPDQEIRNLAKNPLVQVVGEVPDIRPFLQNANVALAPLKYGVGIQNKVLEAMACGTPVVSTSQAVSALDTTSGQDILVADAPEEFARTVCNLLRDPQEQNRIGQAGRNYVEMYHNWQNIVYTFEQVYSQAYN